MILCGWVLVWFGVLFVKYVLWCVVWDVVSDLCLWCVYMCVFDALVMMCGVQCRTTR